MKLKQMQEEAVFKVPTTRRCLLNLFCKETLDDLENVWNEPHSPITNTFFEYSCNGITTITCENDDLASGHFTDTNLLNVSEAPNEKLEVDSNSSASQDGSFLPRCDNVNIELGNREDKYTVALLDQFKAPIFNQQLNSHQYVNNPNSDVDNIMSSKSPEILLIKDESMASADSDSSGSDVDWYSCTPLVPGSPGDHVVPDLDDLYWDSSPICPKDHIVPHLDVVDSQNVHTSQCLFDNFPFYTSS
ncbi:hypothetical protein Btru_057668 [Bulinus truncatus]|nr:hypothetical protein Btru_057668 [Bulinus truncatus]